MIKNVLKIKFTKKNATVVKLNIDNWFGKHYSTLIEIAKGNIDEKIYLKCDLRHRPSSINLINFNKNRNYKHNDIFTLGNGGGGDGSQLMRIFNKNLRSLLQFCHFHSSSYYQSKRTMNQMLSYVTDSRGSKNSTDYRIYFRKYFILCSINKI